MADNIPFSNGAGGDFIADDIPNAVTLSGAGPGDILTITPDSNKRVRLTRMFSNAVAGNSGITITFGSRVVISDGVISNYTAEAGDWFWIDNTIGSVLASDNGNGISHITGGVGEELVLSISGAIDANIYVKYEVGS